MRGFSLVELTLAIGVAAFCLIAVFGLIPVGVQTNRNSTSETQATTIIALAIADLRAAQIGPQYGSPMFGFFPIPTDPTSPPQFVAPDCVPCSGGQTSSTSQIRYIDSVGQSSTSFNASTSRYRLIVTFEEHDCHLWGRRVVRPSQGHMAGRNRSVRGHAKRLSRNVCRVRPKLSDG